MNRMNLLKVVAIHAFALLALGLVAGTQSARAQCPGCPGQAAAGLGYWVNYDYVYGPCAPGPVFVLTLHFKNGTSTTVESVDGHFTYDQDPAWGPADSLTIDLVPGTPFPGFPLTLPVPCQKIAVQSPCGGILEIEIKCNPCIEIRLKI